MSLLWYWTSFHVLFAFWLLVELHPGLAVPSVNCNPRALEKMELVRAEICHLSSFGRGRVRQSEAPSFDVQTRIVQSGESKQDENGDGRKDGSRVEKCGWPSERTGHRSGAHRQERQPRRHRRSTETNQAATPASLAVELRLNATSLSWVAAI